MGVKRIASKPVSNWFSERITITEFSQRRKQQIPRQNTQSRMSPCDLTTRSFIASCVDTTQAMLTAEFNRYLGTVAVAK